MHKTHFWLLALALVIVAAALWAIGGDLTPSQAAQPEFLPLIQNGKASSTPTPTRTATPTATPTSTATSTSTATPEGTPIAVDLFVDDGNSTATKDGTIKHPYNTLQKAIAAAKAGETIAVASGTYSENVSIQGKTIHLYGGYVGGNAARYAQGKGGDFSARDPNANLTHLVGDGTDSVVTLIEAGASTVDGFYISGGSYSREPEFGYYGGGFYINGGSPTIAHNRIEKNNALPAEVAAYDDSLGGGIYAGNADISIRDNVIVTNTAGRGAGIAIAGGTVVIDSNLVQDNTGVSNHGGGIYVASPHAEITHNRVINNEIGRSLGYGWGGGILVYGDGAFAHIAFNTVTANYAPSVGAGIFIDDGAVAALDHELIYNNDCPTGGTTGGVGLYVDGYDTTGSHVTVDQSTIAGNSCETQGGNGLYVEGYSVVTVTNSIFWDNNKDDFYSDPHSHITMTYSLAQEPLSGVGNLFVNPLFADAAHHDYHLQSKGGRWNPAANGGSGAFVIDAKQSPAIDAGNPAAPFANEPSPNGGSANMGVYGNTEEASKSAP